jgi:integrase/recombinase XerD
VTSTYALQTPSAGPYDDAFMAAAGFLAGYSGSTLAGYKIDLRGWFNFCAQHDLPVFEARRPHIEFYARSLEEGADRPGRWQGTPYAKPTICRRISTVACFYKWCDEEEIISKNPAAHIRRPKPDTESTNLGLDRNELGSFLVQAGLGSPMEHALAVLLALNGLRISEACNADIEDLGFQRGHHTLVVLRKGGHHELIPLAPRTARTVLVAVDERTEGPIFLRKDGRRLDKNAGYRIVKRLARRARIDHKVGPHSLRHAAITAVLDAGVDIRDAQIFAGHADPRTTILYDRNRKALDRHATYILAAFVAGASGGGR